MYAMRKSTSRKVHGYMKAVLALAAVRQKREERYTRNVHPLDRNGICWPPWWTGGCER